jgi:hypothetical protein
MIKKVLGVEFVSPEEMTMLQRVFDAVCDDPDKKSPAADDDASLVVALFRTGFREESELLHEIRIRKSQRGIQTAAKDA